MPMGGFTLSPNAQRSLKGIQAYTVEQFGEEQANRYLADLRDRMRALAEQPLLGIRRDDIKSTYYSYFEGSHTIYYYIEGPGSIAIIDVLHQSMDPTRHMYSSR